MFSSTFKANNPKYYCYGDEDSAIKKKKKTQQQLYFYLC